MFSVYGQVDFKCVREGEGNFPLHRLIKPTKMRYLHQYPRLTETFVNYMRITASFVVNSLSQKGTSFARSFLTLKPIWTYGILCRTASTSSIEILECFQSKALRMIVDALWYVRIRLSAGISKYATALNTVLASAHIQMT
jgi:hypothetical protein